MFRPESFNTSSFKPTSFKQIAEAANDEEDQPQTGRRRASLSIAHASLLTPIEPSGKKAKRRRDEFAMMALM